jgi:hypothetical protein
MQTDIFPGQPRKRTLSSLVNSLRKTISQFLYGMTVHEVVFEIRKGKGHLNNLCMFIVFGGLV